MLLRNAHQQAQTTFAHSTSFPLPGSIWRMDGAECDQNFNPMNEWVMIYSVSSDDSWITSNLPATNAVFISPVNGSKFYLFRNIEPLPRGEYFWLDGGDGCVVTTDIYEPFNPPSAEAPGFPIHSSRLIHGEPEFVDVIPYDEKSP